MNNKTDHQVRIEQMMSLAGQDLPNKPVLPDEKTRELRAKLILEECLETIRDLGFHTCARSDDSLIDCGVIFVPNGKENLIGIADGCADISVVTIGTLSACGIADYDLLEEVDENNLLKFGPGGYRREDGKWIKPPNHPKPNIEEAIGLNV